MSRIATLTAVLTMAAAPAALAGPADYGSQGAQRVIVAPEVSRIDLRSPDAQTGYVFARAPQSVVAHSGVDLRSPDAVNGFVSPAATPKSAPADDGNLSGWAVLAIIAAAFGACGLLTVMLRRHFEVGRPLGA